MPTTETRHAGLALFAVCTAILLDALDLSITQVALPSIRHDLDISAGALQWVANAYVLTYGGFLLLGGRAADLLGRRRVFLAGLATFGVMSLACGIAPSAGTLVLARGLQGLGAALTVPASVAIIATTFAEGEPRNRALGVFAAAASAGFAVGLVLGGLLTDLLSWQWVLFINVPIGLVAAALSPRYVAEGRDRSRVRNFDAAGAVSATLGVVAIVFAIVRTDVNGWGSAQTILVLAGGLALIGVFLLIEGRLASHPLMPLRIFQSRALSSANAIVFLLGAAMFAMWYFVSLYLQQVLGYSPLVAGVAFIPMTLTIAAASTVASRLVSRIGAKPLLITGMLAQTAGMLLFSRVSADGSFVSDVLLAGIVTAGGMGAAFVPVTIAAVSGVDSSEAGLASGLVNTSRLLGGALGLAVLATLATERTASLAHDGVAAAPALTEGFRRAFEVGAGFSLAGALVAIIALRVRAPRSAPAAATEPAG
jgi:EmrB/QacA subfamily drug resistance transporter